MSWLESAFGIEPEPVAKPAKAPRVIKSMWVATRHPGGAPGDRGAAMPAWFYVENGAVTLCDRHGQVAGSENDPPNTFRPAPGDDPRAVVSRVVRDRSDSTAGVRGFRGPLNYGRLGLV